MEEWDSSVKRLDFEDVSLVVDRLNVEPEAAAGAEAIAAPAPSEGSIDMLSESGAPSGASMVGLPDNCSIPELRQEAQRIRKDLTSVETFVSDFSSELPQKLKADAEAEQHSMKRLKEIFSALEAESLELQVKQGILERLAEWKIGDEKHDDESWMTVESDTNNMGDELTALKNANAETIQEIESLIRTVASDVNGLETDLSKTFGDLDAFDSEVDKLAEKEARDNDANTKLSVLYKQSENLHDLESTIRQLEETLKQNEKEYVEAEAAMESRIEQYNLEIEELQAQASQLDKEEECMRILIDVTSRFLQSRKHMEYSNDVTVVSMEKDSIEIHLTTHLPNLDAPRDEPDQESDPMWEHSLHIKINQDTMEIEEAKLSPEAVPIDDLLSEARQKRVTTASLETVKEAQVTQFEPQLASLVRAVHQRLTIHAFKLASLSNAANDPRERNESFVFIVNRKNFQSKLEAQKAALRKAQEKIFFLYSVEHIPGSPLITIVQPGKLRAVMEIPENWPMHGYSLRLRSLQMLEAPSGEATTDDTVKMAVEVANEMPDYIRHDLFTFMQAVERITTE